MKSNIVQSLCNWCWICVSICLLISISLDQSTDFLETNKHINIFLDFPVVDCFAKKCTQIPLNTICSDLYPQIRPTYEGEARMMQACDFYCGLSFHDTVEMSEVIFPEENFRLT